MRHKDSTTITDAKILVQQVLNEMPSSLSPLYFPLFNAGIRGWNEAYLSFCKNEISINTFDATAKKSVESAMLKKFIQMLESMPNRDTQNWLIFQMIDNAPTTPIEESFEKTEGSLGKPPEKLNSTAQKGNDTVIQISSKRKS